MALRDDMLSWGGADDSRQARLDAAYAEAEARHHGTDGGLHHRTVLTGHLALVRATEFSAMFPDWPEDEQ